MDIGLIVIIAVVAVVIIYLIAAYNGLVKLRERVNEAWSDITVQLKRRTDLIPNLIETVKGYAKHEKETLQGVTNARAAMNSALSKDSTVEATAKADKQFTDAFSKLMLVAEAYPDLKANTNFQQLSSELSDTEDKIQAARRFYNAGAKELNTKISQFPVNILNSFFKFEKRDYYEVDESEKEAIKKVPEVKF